ncbi:MAG TPA: hypothetical protein VF941_00240 [Clostridia bacterium]
MDNLPSKALIFRDWKYSKWFIPVIFIELFFMYVPGFLTTGEVSQLNAPGIYGGEGERFAFYILLLALTISLMSINLFHYDTNPSCRTLSASMPFTRKEIIISKWLVGLYNISMPQFAVFLIMNSLLICNFCWTNYFLNLLSWSIVNFLILLALFSFTVLVQSMNSSSILGGIMASLFALFPITLFSMLSGIIDKHYGEQNILLPDFLERFVRSGITNKIVSWVNFLFNTGNADIMTYPNNAFNQSLSGFILRCIFFLLFTLTFLVLSTMFFRKSSSYKNNHNQKSGVFRRLSMAILAYMAGYAMNMFYLALAGPGAALRPDIVLIFCVVIPIPVYFIIGLIIKKCNIHPITGGSL